MAKAKSSGDDDGYGTDEGDTGTGLPGPDTSNEGDNAPDTGGVVAGRDDIPVDPGNSGATGDNVYTSPNRDDTGDDTE